VKLSTTVSPNTFTSHNTALDRPNESHHIACSLSLFHKALKPNKPVASQPLSYRLDLLSAQPQHTSKQNHNSLDFFQKSQPQTPFFIISNLPINHD
jgi:hypothetical protein